MTEQQIENLRRVLSLSDEEQNSSELDEKILAVAKAKAPRTKPHFLINYFNVQSINFATSAAVSVLLTVGLFLGLSQILSVDDSFSNTDELFHAKEAQTNKREISQPELVLEHELIARPLTESARDQILVDMELPEVSGLLDNMQFSIIEDRVIAQQAMLSAMEDIRYMVMNGGFNDARDRYDRLRRTCSVCTLPDTLEALVLNTASFSGKI